MFSINRHARVGHVVVIARTSPGCEHYNGEALLGPSGVVGAGVAAGGAAQQAVGGDVGERMIAWLRLGVMSLVGILG